MSQTFLEVRNLVKIFGKLTAVDNVSFKVEQGEVVTLLGPSGCGKTTTLRMVAGFEKPNAGEVEIAGRVVVATNRRINVPPERRDIGMVFQSYAIWPHMTVLKTSRSRSTCGAPIARKSSGASKKRLNWSAWRISRIVRRFY